MTVLFVILAVWAALGLAYAHPILFMAGTLISLGILALTGSIRRDRLAIHKWRAGRAERIRRLERETGIRP